MGMDDIKSGRELCDNFFDNLLEREDIDQRVAVLARDLYGKNQLTVDRVKKGLKALRQEAQDEQHDKG